MHDITCRALCDKSGIIYSISMLHLGYVQKKVNMIANVQGN